MAVILSRLSRSRFISRSRKTNGEIVSKILTAHLGEHVPPGDTPPFYLYRGESREERRRGESLGIKDNTVNDVGVVKRKGSEGRLTPPGKRSFLVIPRPRGRPGRMRSFVRDITEP